LLFEGLKKYIFPCSLGNNHDWKFIDNSVKLKNSFWHSNIYNVDAVCLKCKYKRTLEIQIEGDKLLSISFKYRSRFDRYGNFNNIVPMYQERYIYRDYEWGTNVDMRNYKLREQEIINYINNNIDMEQKKSKLKEQYETFDKYCLNKEYISKDIIKENI
jgi:hypothetical protein